MNTPVQPKPADLAAAFEGPRGWVEGVRYGFMAFPLAFVALPLYVLWPNHFARAWGVPLAALGALLLAVRLADALIDPLLGQMVDALGRQKNTYRKAILRSAGMGCALLMLGFVALFFPPAALAGHQAGLLAWAGLALVLTYLAFSGLTVAHQAWAHAWAARLPSAAGWWAGAKGWVWPGWWWPRCCPRWPVSQHWPLHWRWLWRQAGGCGAARWYPPRESLLCLRQPVQKVMR